MRVYKRSYRDKQTGETKQAGKWYVDCYDQKHDLMRQCPGYADKKATAELGRKLEKLAARAAERMEPDQELRQWLEAQPPKMHERLFKWGLIDAARAAAGKRLPEHVADFKAVQLAEGRTERQARQNEYRIERLFTLAGCTYWSDITASGIQTALGKLRKGKRPVSIQTVNHYLTAAKAFCNWMVAEGRAQASPIANLRRQKVTDSRERRALSVEEVQALIDQADAGEPWRWGGDRGHGEPTEAISGQERAVLYRLATETGLRASELRSLTRAGFELEGDDPAVTVAGAYTKNGQAARLPLRPATAAVLAEHLKHKAPAAQAFNVPPDTARMMRADLADAREAWLSSAPTKAERQEREKSAHLCDVDHAGRITDFHSLRHTCGSWLAAAGVHPKVVQRIMRHHSITLTMDRYTHLFKGDEAAAIGKLPGLDAPGADAQAATGTEHARAQDAQGAQGAQSQSSAKDAQRNSAHSADRLTVRSAVHNHSQQWPKHTEANTTAQGAESVASSVMSEGCADSDAKAGHAPGRIRTPNLRFRRPPLCPVELRVRSLDASPTR